MDIYQVQEQIRELDILQLCETMSTNDVYLLIRKICGPYVNEELSDLFGYFVTPASILGLIRTVATNYPNKMPRDVLFDIWRILVGFIECGAVDEYYYLWADDSIHRLSSIDLLLLKERILERLAKSTTNEPEEEVWIEEDDNFLTKETV